MNNISTVCDYNLAVDLVIGRHSDSLVGNVVSEQGASVLQQSKQVATDEAAQPRPNFSDEWIGIDKPLNESPLIVSFLITITSVLTEHIQ